MPSDYDRIRADNKREYGEGTRHLAYFADLYSTRTHFIYELLQNAEDALSRHPQDSPEGYVRFNLFEDRLEFRHNGAAFVENDNRKDVSGICGIGEGTKSGDYTQIGKFGIGFKSVYAYTFAPRIHSKDENFEIRRFVEPHGLQAKDAPPMQDGETCIVLPFDSPDVYPPWAFRDLLPAEQAVREIGNALRNLGIRSLLFLRQIAEIKWTLPGTSGHFLREVSDETPSSKLVTVTDGENIEMWRVFVRTVAISDGKHIHDIKVEVAFRQEEGKVRSAEATELVAYFPTEKKTGLGFLIQAPFTTTKARDNIKFDYPANGDIIEAAAQLAADSLENLRDFGLLGVASYEALPLKVPDADDRFFRPVYEKIRKALKEKPLLPVQSGGFVKAEEVKLARGAKLVELFTPVQLGALFGRARLEWLNATIAENTALHDYIAGRRKQYSNSEWSVEPLISDVLIDAEKIASKLSAEFLAAQSDQWLVQFYGYIQDAKTFAAFEKTPLIRLESGKHILPFRSDGKSPAAYLPPKSGAIDETKFSLVKSSLASDPLAQGFLREVVHLSEPDRVAVVIECLLPSYPATTVPFTEKHYIGDLQQISEAFQKADEDARKRLLERLSSTNFVACSRAGDSYGTQIVWKRPGDKNIFYRSSDLENWFAGNLSGEAWFPHPSIEGHLDGDLRGKLGFASGALLKRTAPNSYPYRRPEGGFDAGADIVELDFALKHITASRAAFLWGLLLENIALIKGKELQCRFKAFRVEDTKEINISSLGQKCIETGWIPVGDKFLRPIDALLSDLPPEFERDTPRAKSLSLALGMKQPEREQALEIVTGGDPTLKMIIEYWQSSSDAEREKMLKVIPTESTAEAAPPFKEGLKSLGRRQRGTIDSESPIITPVSDPDRYKTKLSEDVEEAVETHKSTPRRILFSPVREQPSNAEARSFLYEQYHGRCQVTGTTFPKASMSSNGLAENYFEACSLLAYTNAEYLNDAGNMLCVSADTMAKFKCASVEFLDSLEDTIESFKTNGERTERVSVRIRLAGEVCTVNWSQRHFMRLVALYEKA